MSWAEEQDWFGLEDLALEAQERYEEAQRLIKQNIWVQANSERINLCAMTYKHLCNCIRIIEEGRLNRKYALPYLKAEQQKRLRQNKLW